MLNENFIYPNNLIEEFFKRAVKEKDDKGFPKELMAFVAGYKENDILIATELIFPEQSGDASNVDDEGKLKHFKQSLKINASMEKK